MVVASTLIARNVEPTDINDLVDPGAVFLANYENGVTLTTNYTTVEQRSRTGAGQRYGLADAPKISTTASTLPISSAQVRLMNDQLIRRTKSRQPFPLYSDSFAISAGTGGGQSTTFNVDESYDLNYRRVEAEQYCIIAPVNTREAGGGCIDNYLTRKVVSVSKGSTPQTITFDDTLDFQTFGGGSGSGFTPPSLKFSDYQSMVTGFDGSDVLVSSNLPIKSGDILVVSSCGVGFGGASSTPGLATVIPGSIGTVGSAPTLTMTSFGALSGGTIEIDGEEFLPAAQYSYLIITEEIETYFQGQCKSRTAFTHGASDVCSLDHHTFLIKNADTNSPIQDTDTKDVSAGGQSASTEEDFAQTQDNTLEQGTSFFFPKATALEDKTKLKPGTGATEVEVEIAGDLSGVSGIGVSAGSVSGCFSATQTTTSDISCNFKTDSLGSFAQHRVQCGYLSLKPTNTQLNRLRDGEIQLRVYPAIEAEASPETSIEIIHDELETVELVAEQTPGTNTLSPLATVANHGRTYKAVFDYDSGEGTRNVELPIFDFQVNYGSGVDGVETADIDRTDVGLGRASRSYGDKGRRQFGFEILALNRDTAWSFLEFWHSRRGRLLPFWFPSLSTELKPLSLSGTVLTVDAKSLGTAAEIASRGYLCFYTKTGGRAIAAISSASETTNGHITITIDTSPTDDVDGTTFSSIVTGFSDISFVKFVTLCTFDSDSITENWITNDICQMDVGVVELTKERDADSSFGIQDTAPLDAVYTISCNAFACAPPNTIIGSCSDDHCCVCESGMQVKLNYARIVSRPGSTCDGCRPVVESSPSSPCCFDDFGPNEYGGPCSIFLNRDVTGEDADGNNIYGNDSFTGPGDCNYIVYSAEVIYCRTFPIPSLRSVTLYMLYKPTNSPDTTPFVIPNGVEVAGGFDFGNNVENWQTVYSSAELNGLGKCGDNSNCNQCNTSGSPCLGVPTVPISDGDFDDASEEGNGTICFGPATLGTQKGVIRGSCDPLNGVCGCDGENGCTSCCDATPCSGCGACIRTYECETFPALEARLTGYTYTGFCPQGEEFACTTCNPFTQTQNLEFSTVKSDKRNFNVFLGT